MKKGRFFALTFLAMRITITPFLFVLMTATAMAKDVRGQDVLDRPISIRMESARLKAVLREMQTQAGVKFVFSSLLIDANRRISVVADRRALGEVLREVTERLELNYRLLGNQVIIYARTPPAEELSGIPVHGVVRDEKGQPLSGATVHVKGSKASAITDGSGAFTLNNVKENAVLVISYVGYSNQEVTVSGQAELSIVLKEGNTNLNQVVVIGYGAVRKKDVVGAVDVVAVKDAGANTSTNTSALLIGKSAGVQVIQSNGTPGSDAQIIIRGTGSFTSIEPLYVIDGVQGDKNLFNLIAPQDIENITILKDATYAGIYGVGAANGVVLVTTKKGRAGAPKISATSQWGVAKAWKQLHLLNARQYVDLLKDYAATLNTALPAKFSTPAVLVDSNDWQKNIFRSGLISENDISLSGGSEKVLYTFSVGYQTQKAIVRDYDYKRFTTRMGLDETLGIFRFGQTLNFRYVHTTGQTASIMDAIGYEPYKPVFIAGSQGAYSYGTNVDDFNGGNNPLQILGVQNKSSYDLVIMPQLYGEVGLLKGLRFRSQLNGTIGQGKTQSYQYPYIAGNSLAYTRQATLNYYNYSSYLLENYFSYDRQFGDHKFTATLGNSYKAPGSSTYSNVTGSSIANDVLQNTGVATSLNVTGSGPQAVTSTISYFGRLIYSFRDRYMLSALFRRDGSSVFGPNNRFGNFPAFGVGWKFSEENFFRDIKFINEGKVRAGWGRTGNGNIAAYQTTPLTYSGSPSGNLVYSLGQSEAFVTGVTVNSFANPDLKWETTDQTDIGIDLTLADNHINFTADWYKRKSYGLLVSIPVPLSTGVGNTGATPVKTENAADALNRGFEVSLGYQTRINNDVSINISGNFSYNHNEVLGLGSQFSSPIQAGSFNQLSTFTYTAKGTPVGAFYGYVVDHVAKDQAEITALNQKAQKATGNPNAVYQSGLLPGDFIFKDINGSGIVTDSDQRVLGSPIPKFIYGFNAGVTFRNFDFNLVISGVAGVQVLNAMKFQTEIEATGHNATTAILNRWRQSGDIAALPRAGQNATSSGNLRASDWWLENGSYLRIRNLTFGYSVPAQRLKSWSGGVVTRLRFYVAAENLLTATKYSGYDPEVSNQSGGNYLFTRGIDDGQLPQPRTFLAGVQLGF